MSLGTAGNFKRDVGHGRQRWMILTSLHEAHEMWKTEYPGVMLGFSNFADTHPQWCVLAAVPGVHAVCLRCQSQMPGTSSNHGDSTNKSCQMLVTGQFTST